MSFIKNDTNSKVYAPGHFLAHEECTRDTRQFNGNSALVETTPEGGKYVPMGTVYPTNDGNAIGITYEDVDVTNGNMPGSVVTKGEVYESRLAVTLDAEAKTALKALGFKFVSEPTVTRPDWTNN